MQTISRRRRWNGGSVEQVRDELTQGVIVPQQTASKPILGFGVPSAPKDDDDWDD